MLEERGTQSDAEPVLRGTEALTAAPRSEGAIASVYRDPVTWAIALTVFGAYAALSLFRLVQLNPTSWDLGIYTEYVKQAAGWHMPITDVRTAGFNLLGDHFQPIVMLLAP